MGVIPNGNQPDPSRWAELEANANNRMAEQFQRMTAQMMRDRESERATAERDNSQNANRLAQEGMRQAGNMAYLGQQQSFAREQAGAQNGQRHQTALGNRSTDENIMQTYNALIDAGFSHEGAIPILGEIGRETSFNSRHLFGTHAEPVDVAAGRTPRTNGGLISWNQDRLTSLMKYLGDRNLLDPQGRMLPGQETLNAQAQFLRREMMQRGEGDIVTHLSGPNVDRARAAAELGDRTIRWVRDPNREYRVPGDRAINSFMSRAEALTAASPRPGVARGGAVPSSATSASFEDYIDDPSRPLHVTYFSPSAAPDGFQQISEPEGNQPATRPTRSGVHLGFVNERAALSRNNTAIARARHGGSIPLPPEPPDDVLALRGAPTPPQALPSAPQQPVAPGNAAILGQAPNAVTGPAVRQQPTTPVQWVRVNGQLTRVPDNTATR